jgi:hypothetical protein
VVAILLTLSFPSSAQIVPAASPPHEKIGYEDLPPEGVFSSIVTAHGQELVMGPARSFALVPVKPSKAFSPDVPEIFVVFNLHQHDAEFQVYGRWVFEKGEGMPPNRALGTDAMILNTEDQSGYLSMKRPGTAWPVGDYKVEISIGTGASDMSPIGTLRFSILPAKTPS